VVAVALAVTAAVAALGMEATFRQAPPSPDETGLRALVYGLQGLLALVAVAGIVAVGLVGLRERRRELAVLSAVGFSTRQLGASMVAGQGALAGAGAVLGIPLGIGFFRLAYALANGSSAGLVDAPPLHLLAVVPVAVLVAGMVAAVPASALRRLPAAAALRPA
jgi:ABC-type antimicrobial peptide transport system permease subunit